MADQTKIQSRKSWREAGYNVENAEFFVQISGGRKVKRDLFGFVDLVAIPGPGNWIQLPLEHRNNLSNSINPVVFIQVTSWTHVPTRRRKILTETTGKGQWEVPIRELVAGLLRGGSLIVVEGWRKKGRVWGRRQHWFTEEELKS